MFYPVKMVNLSPDNKQLLIKTGIGVVLFFWGKHLYENWQKSQGEAKLNTPEGQIAGQLRNIFDSFPVDDTAYRRVMQQVNTANEQEVRDIYKLLTGRFLTDDEAKHINSSTQESAAKQYKINNTQGTLISIVNDEIKFNVGRGSLIRFAPGRTTPIDLYLQPEDIATGAKAAVTMPPNSKYWKVTDTKLVPVKGLAMRKDWKIIFAYILPLFALMRIRKEYAAVQIDISGGTGQTFVWANATDFRTQKSLHGIEGANDNSFAITTSIAEIFNEQWRQTGIAPKDFLVGFPILTLDTGKGTYIKLKTIQGFIRWIRADKVIIRRDKKIKEDDK